MVVLGCTYQRPTPPVMILADLDGHSKSARGAKACQAARVRLLKDVGPPHAAARLRSRRPLGLQLTGSVRAGVATKHPGQQTRLGTRERNTIAAGTLLGFVQRGKAFFHSRRASLLGTPS